MKKLVIVAICLVSIFFQSCSSRYWMNNFKNNSINYTSKDTVIEKLQKRSNVLIVLNNGVQRNRENYNYILSLQGKNWYKVVYEDKGIRSETYKTFTYEVSPVDKKKGDSVLKVFTDNRFWEIKDNDEGCDEMELIEAEKNSTIRCGRIHDGENPVLSISIKNKASIKTYYAPEHYLCCKGYEDRKVFIACKNAVLSTQ